LQLTGKILLKSTSAQVGFYNTALSVVLFIAGFSGYNFVY